SIVDSKRQGATVNAARPRTINYQLSTIHYPRRQGFSFAEVMFAVIVLGIGFIMIAAIFPVAIQQSKATNDETSGAAIAKAQVAALSDIIAEGIHGAVEGTGTLASTSDVPALTPIPPALNNV